MILYLKLYVILPGPASQKKLHKGTKGAVAWGKRWFQKVCTEDIWSYLDNSDTIALALWAQMNWDQFADADRSTFGLT